MTLRLFDASNLNTDAAVNLKSKGASVDVKGEFLEILEGLRSEKLAAFSQKLIKSPEILGVKTPELRRLAKQNFGRLNLEQIAEYEPFFHEEFM